MNLNWSYWEKTTFSGRRDVIIVGAGITGLSAAITLKNKRPNKKVLILESGMLPSGASTKNAGFACFGSLSELISDEKHLGLDGVLTLVEKRWKGLELLRQNIGDRNLDYQPLGGFEIFSNEDQELAKSCLDHLHHYNQALSKIIGENVFEEKNGMIDRFGLTGISTMIANNYEGQLDTGRMIKALLDKCRALDVEIRFGMSVESVMDKNIVCKNGLEFSAHNILIATNGFAKQLLDVSVKPARAQVLVTKPIKKLKLKGTFHYDEGYYYFRNIHDRLLIGGGRNVAFDEEETTEMQVTDKIQRSIKKIIDRHILSSDSYEIDYAWSGIMGVGGDKKPIVKKINENTVIAVKLGGMGVAIGSLVGKEAAELLMSDDE